MKRLTFGLTIALALLLLAAGCTRILDRDGDEPTPTPEVSDGLPTVDPNLFPTATPLAAPGEGYPAPGEGEQPPGDATAVPGGEATAVPEGEATAVPEAEATPRTTEVEYVVVSGDTVGRIAERYGVTIDAIVRANNLANANVLDVGDVLIIPPPGAGGDDAGDDGGDDGAAQEERVHIVQRGETLFRIGLAYGYTVQELADYNDLDDPNDLEVGQQILIPPSP